VPDVAASFGGRAGLRRLGQEGDRHRAATGARDKAVKEVNAKLLAEGRKNQCSFKTDSDELRPSCDQKLKKLANPGRCQEAPQRGRA
jgi:OOP family OmpA-OmpF porin